MPASADIYGAIQQPRPINRLAELANVMQIQGLQQQGDMGRMKMDEYRRDREQENALSAAYSSALSADGKLDRNKLLSAAASSGLGAKIPGIQKGFADQDKSATDADQAKFKLANERYGVFQKTMGALKDVPNLSKQMVMEAGANLVQQGILPKEMYDGAVANMPDDPAQLRARLTQGLATQLPPEKVFELFAPKPEKFDTGGQILTRDMNPNSPTFGQNVGGAPVAKEQSPDNKASVGASLANAAATRDVAAATRDAAKMNKTYESEQGLRKEFEALPEVKNYKTALPSFNGVKDAASRNTTQSDINIVYGIAKLYDPTSVVREGEYATVANSPNIPERIKGYAQYLAGGGRLTPKVKAEILAEATSRMKSYEDQYTTARTDFESIAQRSGVDPTRVFPSAAKPATSPAPKPAGAPAAGGGLSAEEQKELDALRARFGKGK